MTNEVHGIKQRVSRIPEQAIRMFTRFCPHDPAKRHCKFQLRQRRSGKQAGTPVPVKTVTERVLADSPDLVAALAQPTEILKMEFADTRGSGYETLVKCEKVLQRTNSTQTIELPLF
jgi:hypothetical protein